MSVDSAIQRFRQRQLDVFRGTATVERPSGTTTFDPVTGVETPDPPTLIYSGPSLIRAFTWEGTDVEVGGAEVRLRRVTAKFPVDTDLQKDDIITPTGSTYDAGLVGRHYRVTDTFPDDWQIVRKVIGEEVVG